MTTPVSRGSGRTVSEKYLSKLADRTFLDLWSYPNTYIDKMHFGQGKELCDLLVVCGDHVIVFSDKMIAWPEVNDLQIAWARWYKRAIEKSVNQLRGAARWLTDFPDRIFLDPACKVPLPIPFPPLERMRFHGIVVARGAGSASRAYYQGGSGSLAIMPAIKGKGHYDANSKPLICGDVNPNGFFVHVLDDGSLDIVMTELDTISDLTEYLSKKEALVRSGNLVGAEGEEDLVAYFMTHMDSPHGHGFSRPDGSPIQPTDRFVIEGVYHELRDNPRYIAKKDADRVSYLWDRLIEVFTENLLAGTTILPEGQELDLKTHELGVRLMAQVPRFVRRQYGDGIREVLELSSRHERFVRAFVNRPEEPNSDTAFFFLTLKVPDFELKAGYEQYRHVRSGILETYALTFLRRHPHLERIVGVGTEPKVDLGTKSKGSSEDMIVAAQPEWTDDLLANLQARQERFDILRDGRYREYRQTGQEWPEADDVVDLDIEKDRQMPNRKMRRVLAAKERRRRHK